MLRAGELQARTTEVAAPDPGEIRVEMRRAATLQAAYAGGDELLTRVGPQGHADEAAPVGGRPHPEIDELGITLWICNLSP